MSGDELSRLLRAVGDDGDPHAELFERRLAGPPSLEDASPYSTWTRDPLHDPTVPRRVVGGAVVEQDGTRYPDVHLVAEVLAEHRQAGDRCAGCGGLWPCDTRRTCIEQCRPVRVLIGVDEAGPVLRLHRPVDGRCWMCGAVWPCGPVIAARTIYQRAGLPRPAPDDDTPPESPRGG